MGLCRLGPDGITFWEIRSACMEMASHQLRGAGRMSQAQDSNGLTQEFCYPSARQPLEVTFKMDRVSPTGWSGCSWDMEDRKKVTGMPAWVIENL